MYAKTGDHRVFGVSLIIVRFASKYDFPLIPIICCVRSSQHYRDETNYSVANIYQS